MAVTVPFVVIGATFLIPGAAAAVRPITPLLHTVILGLLWGGWHLPPFLTADWGRWPDASLSLIMTWVFSRTGQRVLVVTLVLLVVTRGRLGLVADAPSGGAGQVPDDLDRLTHS